MNDRKPRGIRMNNPGNIELGAPWQGAVPREQNADPRFVQFTAPAWGVRALARTLITYYDKHRINTVRGAISRWAPPSENNTGAYIAQVARAVNVDPGQVIDFHSYDVLRPMVEAIIRHENGQGPLNTPNTWYGPAVIDEGLRMAGVIAHKRSALMTPEGAAAGTAAAAGGTAAVVEIINAVTPAVQQVQTVSYATDGLPSWLRVTLIVLTLVGAAAAAYVFWSKRRTVQAVEQ